MSEKPRQSRIVALAHHFASLAIRDGDRAVDATAGNGHDTVFLARAVGDEGKVFAFDVQEAAIERARARAEAEGLAARIDFRLAGHERLADCFSSLSGRVKIVMFNLGYLPGGNKSIITEPSTTITALDASLKILAPGGRITIVAYPGHPGGDAESVAVRSWALNLDRNQAETFGCHLLAPGKNPPLLRIIDKKQ